MNKIKLIVVAGPTASGKTSLALDIAERVGGEIVSADSMQIYKYMDIGTAKPTAEEQARAVHHLIDFADPARAFSVADYTELAHKTVADIVSRGKMPVVVGGTGLYINSLIDDVSFGEMEVDYKLREELSRIAEEEGGERLLEMLNEIDPVSAARMHPNNVRRIIRAIEFYRVSGIPISKHQEETKKTVSRYEPIMFCVDWDREVLYERINKRVDIMIEDGLLDEVKNLLDMGYTRELNSMQGIGYKELISYLDGECTLDEAIEAIKQGSRRYAKRQLTWFRRDKRIHWLKAGNDIADEAMKIINEEIR